MKLLIFFIIILLFNKNIFAQNFFDTEFHEIKFVSQNIDEDDVNFTYTIQFSIGLNTLLGNNVSPFSLNEYVSFEDVSIVSGSTTR